MCREGPCDGSHHLEALTGITGANRTQKRRQPAASLPPRAYPDAGPRRAAVSSGARRRAILGSLASATALACAPVAAGVRAAAPAIPSGSVHQEDSTPVPAPTSAPAPPTPVPAPTAAPEPQLSRLGAQGIVQPFFAADGSRVLYYDQPIPGQSGTWSIDPATGAANFERPQWGYYVAGDTLLALARGTRRDTYVLHLPSGREWTLPTTNSTVFSNDGTVVAYTMSGAGQPGGPPAAPGSGFSGTAPAFALTSIVVAGADGQNSRRVQLPINGSVLAWLAAPDGAPNARLLLTGRRADPDDPSVFAYDLRDQSLIELARSVRLTGILPSPDGTWVAHVAMWNQDPQQNALWVTRTDGSSRRRVDVVGGYRWTSDNRLIMLPVRAAAGDGHEVWSIEPASGAARRLVDPAKTPFHVSNADWDVSPDGSRLVFVSADDKALWHLSLPAGLRGDENAPLPTIPAPPDPGAGGKPYRLPFTTAPSHSSWYITQWYGVTTGGYRGRNTTYSQGQGIHFGIDFATACGTPVVAVGPGRVIAVDGDYGSPPHNVVIQLDDGNIAMYGHLVERSRHVQVGQRVEPGQVVGNTGDSIAPYNCTRNPHLHLEIRKQGRSVATNPVHFFDVNWNDLNLGVYPGPRFERNLDDPRANQFLDEQPDIWFGGPIITNFSRPWPP